MVVLSVAVFPAESVTVKQITTTGLIGVVVFADGCPHAKPASNGARVRARICFKATSNFVR